MEVISTIDEGRPGEHLRAALLVRRERLAAGALYRGPWSVLLDLGQLCDSCQHTSHEADKRIGKSYVYQQPIADLTLLAVCCPIGAAVGVEVDSISSSWRCVSFFVPCTITSPSEGWCHRHGEVLDAQEVCSGRTARRAEPRNARPTTTPPSCGATTMAAAREVGDLARHISRDCLVVRTSFCELCHRARSRRSFWTATTAPTVSSLQAMQVYAQWFDSCFTSVPCLTEPHHQVCVLW